MDWMISMRRSMESLKKLLNKSFILFFLKSLWKIHWFVAWMKQQLKRRKYEGEWKFRELVFLFRLQQCDGSSSVGLVGFLGGKWGANVMRIAKTTLAFYLHTQRSRSNNGSDCTLYWQREPIGSSVGEFLVMWVNRNLSSRLRSRLTYWAQLFQLQQREERIRVCLVAAQN